MVFLIDVKHTRYKLIGMELSLLILAGLWVIKKILYGLRSFSPAISAPFISIGIVYVIYYIVSPDRLVAYPQLQRMLFSCLAFIAALYMLEPWKRKLVVRLSLICGALISVCAILQYYGGVWRISVPRMSRVYATFGNPNFFASFIAGLIPVGAALYVQKKRPWILPAIIIMLAALYFTYSRGAWLGLMGSGLFWWIFLYKKKSIKQGIVLAVIILCVFASTRSVWMRETSRLIIWRDTLKMFSQNPFFGIGIGRFYAEFPSYASEQLLAILPPDKFIVNYAHNEFLELLVETGIAGFGVYLWLLAVFFSTVLRNRNDDPIYTGALCGSVAVLIHSAVSVNMRFAVSSIWAFYLMGVSAAYVSGQPALDKKQLRFSYLILPSIILTLTVMYFGIKTVVSPLVYHEKLSQEVDFFNRPPEFSEKEIRKSIEQDPEHAMAYYKLGWEQAKRKEFKRAIDSFNRAIELDSSLVGAYNNLGNIYYTTGRHDKAVSYYREALHLNPALVDAHFNLGYIYYHKGRLKEAVEEFKRVIELDPDHYKAKIMLEKMVQ
jgi:O-antigen ligase